MWIPHNTRVGCNRHPSRQVPQLPCRRSRSSRSAVCCADTVMAAMKPWMLTTLDSTHSKHGAYTLVRAYSIRKARSTQGDAMTPVLSIPDCIRPTWYCLRRKADFSTALLLFRFLGSAYHSNRSSTSSVNCRKGLSKMGGSGRQQHPQQAMCHSQRSPAATYTACHRRSATAKLLCQKAPGTIAAFHSGLASARQWQNSIGTM